MTETANFIRKVVSAALIFILLVGIVFIFVRFFSFFLLLFAGILFGVMFRAAASWITGKTKIPVKLSLALVIILIFGIIIGGISLLAPTVSEQFNEIRNSLPASLAKLEEQISEFKWGQDAIREARQGLQNIDSQKAISGAAGFLSTTLGVITDVLLVLIVAIFFAIQPHLYKRGIVKLFPVNMRPRIDQLIMESYSSLAKWLFGKFLTMVFIGITTGIGLWILGVPMAIGLAVIAFFLDFIPTIGPIAAAIPAILIALLEGPMMALYVAILYFVVQSIESYLLQPLIYKKTVSISPVMTLMSLVFFGLTAGALGIILATPLIAIIKVWVKELYIKDFLENPAIKS